MLLLFWFFNKANDLAVIGLLDDAVMRRIVDFSQADGDRSSVPGMILQSRSQIDLMNNIRIHHNKTVAKQMLGIFIAPAVPSSSFSTE